MKKKLRDTQKKLYNFLLKYNEDSSVDVAKLSQEICFLLISYECYVKCGIKSDRILYAYHEIEHHFDPTFKQMREIVEFLDVTQNEISEIINDIFE